MDIDVIESTFNELMSELVKIKELNETAESYKERTRVLSDQLDHFLSVAKEERSAIIKDTEEIKTSLIETDRRNFSSFSQIRSQISEAFSESQHFQENSQRNIIERLDNLISEVILINEKLIQLNTFNNEIQVKVEDGFHAVLCKISDQELNNRDRFEHNEDYLSKVQKIGYAQVVLILFFAIVVILIVLFK